MDAGIASVIAAIIAAAAAGVGLVITKENKTSEFRQDWIDGLRDELAELMEYFLRLRNCNSDEIISVRNKINFLSAKIRLRLSSDTPTNEEKKLLSIISEHIVGADPTVDCTEIVEQYFRYSSSILKSEWERVKRGEKKYRIAVTIAYLILGAFTSYFVFKYIIIASEAIVDVFEFLYRSLL
ncbi:hypothetical protein EO238_18875 [Citrobacter sp. AAK_AS5]|nr:hypothetical protein EO238_18875 [Citrobacter sp. AAK_AS5]